MVLLTGLSLTHFKNYDLSQFSFNERIVGICGLNGKGKTNLLDAIFYCCFTKSYFTSSDNQNIGSGKHGFRIKGNFTGNDGAFEVTCIFRNNKKEFSLNQVPYGKLSDHIGLLPTVIIAPDDVEIITGNADVRRKYLDTLLCQVDKSYLKNLMAYNKLLLQRNSQLKYMAESGNNDATLLQVMEEQMIAPAAYVSEVRQKFMRIISEKSAAFYEMISGHKEVVNVLYESHLTERNMQTIFADNRERDRLAQRTTSGIHKDDIILELNKKPFKQVASQGQRKTLLFALKLAEFQVLKEIKGFTPLLLLDDIFEKLDQERMDALMDWVCNKNDGQVFITDTHYQRIKDVFEKINVSSQIIQLD